MSQPSDFDQILELFYQWWPALVLLAVAYFGVTFLMGQKHSPKRQLDAAALAVHEIRTTLACSEQQAKKLLAIYNGNSAKAISEVKTGKAVLPGAEGSELARYGGEFKSFAARPDGLLLTTHEVGERLVALDSEALLVLGVVDEQQRPDKSGEARADRGKTYGVLFWKVDGDWVRFLLNSSRVDYFLLGEKKVNSAIRNFRLLLDELRQVAPHLKFHSSVGSFETDLRSTHYKTLAALEADASQIFKNLFELTHEA